MKNKIRNVFFNTIARKYWNINKIQIVCTIKHCKQQVSERFIIEFNGVVLQLTFDIYNCYMLLNYTNLSDYKYSIFFGCEKSEFLIEFEKYLLYICENNSSCLILKK